MEIIFSGRKWRLFLAVENSKSEEPHYESLEEKFCNLSEKAIVNIEILARN